MCARAHKLFDIGQKGGAREEKKGRKCCVVSKLALPLHRQKETKAPKRGEKRVHRERWWEKRKHRKKKIVDTKKIGKRILKYKLATVRDTKGEKFVPFEINGRTIGRSF